MKHALLIAAPLAAVLIPWSTSIQAKDSLSVGAGFALQNGAYADYDDDNRVIPMIKFENEYLFVDRGGLGYKLFENKQHRVGIMVGVGSHEWDPDNTNRFRDLDKRHRSIDGGISYRFQDRMYGQFSAKWMTDVSDDHNGHYVDLGYGYPFPVMKGLMLIPSTKISYMDSDYANYYYGVSNDEAGRVDNISAYDTGSAINYGLGLAANYRLTDDWSVTGGANITWLDSDLEDSPLLDDNKESTVFMGVSYKFW